MRFWLQHPLPRGIYGNLLFAGTSPVLLILKRASRESHIVNAKEPWATIGWTCVPPEPLFVCVTAAIAYHETSSFPARA